jgi:hypothetical protein
MPDTYTTISELPNYGSVLGTDRIPVDRLGAAVTAGAFVVDQAYQIVTVGSTSFTAIGAASNTVGAYFVATAAGSGTGTAAPINTGDAPLSAVAALLGGDPVGTAAAAVVAHEAAADPHPTYTTAAELAAAIAGVSGQTQTVTIAVRNNTGSTISKGTPVYVTGSSGTTVTIAPADASTEATAAETLGLTTASIANNTDGTVIAVGLLDGLNTSALTEGQIVWLSETTGALTTTRPTQPAHGVVCGYCVKQGSGTSGIIYVKVDNSLELAELHDVLVAGATSGQFLQLAADGLWKPRTLVAADISDSTATGRAVLTAADAAAARTAIGAGTDTDVIVIPVGDETTALTAGTNKVRFRMPFPATLLAVRDSVNLAPTGSALIVDVNEAGTSVLSTKLSIDATETSSTTAATAAVISDSSLADDAEISIDIDQVGSTVAGAGLKVSLFVRRA